MKNTYKHIYTYLQHTCAGEGIIREQKTCHCKWEGKLFRWKIMRAHYLKIIIMVCMD